MFFNTQSWFFYGFQLILIKQNLCLSNCNLDYNKIDFIYGFHLSSSNSSKAVTKQKCYKNWLVSTWKKLSLKESFKPANRNVCFETVRRPLHEARYENWPIWNWKKSYRFLVKFIWVFTYSEMKSNSYRGRFHIGYFDRFEIQHSIWVVLCIFAVQVCAWKHEKW